MVDRRVEDRFIDFHFGKQDLILKVEHGNGEQTLDTCICARRCATDCLLFFPSVWFCSHVTFAFVSASTSTPMLNIVSMNQGDPNAVNDA